jgi:hypothetical protein
MQNLGNVYFCESLFVMSRTDAQNGLDKVFNSSPLRFYCVYSCNFFTILNIVINSRLFFTLKDKKIVYKNKSSEGSFRWEKKIDWIEYWKVQFKLTYIFPKTKTFSFLSDPAFIFQSGNQLLDKQIIWCERWSNVVSCRWLSRLNLCDCVCKEVFLPAAGCSKAD